MAKQVINIGTTANDGTGDPIRDAFDKVNDNFTELYTDDASDVGSITATAPIERDSATGAVTISLADAGISTAKIADDAVTADKLANSINTEITANTAKENNATHTGDVTGATALTIGDDKVITAKILDANVTTAKIADDGVTFDKLEPRYTGTTTITATSGNTAVDWSTSTVFKLQSACTGAKSFTFSAFKVGQVITFHNLTGGYTITLIATNGTFNKLGEKDYDGSKTNALMVECIDDSANPIFNYSVLTYVSDSTPS